MFKYIPSVLLLFVLIISCKKTVFTDSDYIKKVKEASVIQVHYLALGDSYTKGQGVSLSESFPFLLSDSLHKDEFITVTETRVIAQTGWTTANLILNIQSQAFDKPYDLVSLLIGVNNQYQGKSIEEYKLEFAGCLQKAIQLAGNRKHKVVVISIPDYGYTPFGANNQAYITEAIDAFNNVNKSISDSVGVSYVNITAISRANITGLVAPDNLHPSGKQYKLWVDNMYALMKQKIYAR